MVLADRAHADCRVVDQDVERAEPPLCRLDGGAAGRVVGNIEREAVEVLGQAFTGQTLAQRIESGRCHVRGHHADASLHKRARQLGSDTARCPRYQGDASGPIRHGRPSPTRRRPSFSAARSAWPRPSAAQVPGPAGHRPGSATGHSGSGWR